MTWALANWKILTIAALLCLSFFTGWTAKSTIDEKARLEDAVTVKDALIAASTKNSEVISAAQQEKHNAEIIIDGLMSRKPSGVSLPRPTKCDASTSGGIIPVEPARDLLGEAEAILGEGRLETQSIIGAAEKELNECRVVKKWAEQFISCP